MKAERRHELRENELLHTLEATREYISENGSRIALTVVVVLVIVAAISFGIRARTAAYEDIWRRKAELSFQDAATGRASLQSLAALTRETGDQAFVLQALIDQGRQAIRLSQEVPNPPDLELNKQAREAFEQLRTRFPDNPLAMGVALLGLATVEENEFAVDKDLVHKDRAKAHLDAVMQTPLLNALPFQQIARDRLAGLNATFSQIVVGPPSAPPEVSEAPVEGPPELPAEPQLPAPAPAPEGGVDPGGSP
jgi:hypothetical protein